MSAALNNLWVRRGMGEETKPTWMKIETVYAFL